MTTTGVWAKTNPLILIFLAFKLFCPQINYLKTNLNWTSSMSYPIVGSSVEDKLLYITNVKYKWVSMGLMVNQSKQHHSALCFVVCSCPS